MAKPSIDLECPGVLPVCSNHQTAVLLPPRHEVLTVLLLTCLGDFTHSAQRLINLLGKQRKGRGEGEVQPRVKCSGGVGILGWAVPGSLRSITAREGEQIICPCQDHREVGLGSPVGPQDIQQPRASC